MMAARMEESHDHRHDHDPGPPDVAKAYREATPELKRKWELILRFQLQAILNRPRRSLTEIMDDLGEQAARNGLTEEELQDILREWDEERKAARKAGARPGPGVGP